MIPSCLNHLSIWLSPSSMACQLCSGCLWIESALEEVNWVVSICSEPHGLTRSPHLGLERWWLDRLWASDDCAAWPRLFWSSSFRIDHCTPLSCTTPHPMPWPHYCEYLHCSEQPLPGGTSWLAVKYFLSENMAVQNLIIMLMSSRSLFSPWVGNFGGQLQITTRGQELSAWSQGLEGIML